MLWLNNGETMTKIKVKAKELYKACKELYKDCKDIYSSKFTAAIIFTVTVLFAIGLVIGLMLATYWIMWTIWLFIIPAVFTTAPEIVKYPSFWQFSGACLLIVWVRNLTFGQRKSK